MENETINFNQKDPAKEKIILFVIGVLVGAVISTAAFLVCVNTLGAGNNTNNNMSQMQGGTPPEMSSGQGQNSQGSSNNQGQPPEKPSDNNSNSSQSSNSQNNS